jgi:hypothetical protein
MHALRRARDDHDPAACSIARVDPSTASVARFDTGGDRHAMR